MRARVTAAALAFACAALPLAARADRVAVDAALTVNLLDGRHESSDNDQRVNFAPLPLGEVNARWRHVSLHLEGLPALAIGIGSGNRRETTRLGVFDGALRAHIGVAYAGIGETIYAQRTTYPSAVGSIFSTLDFLAGTLSGSEEQSSRVVGVRFEAGARFADARGGAVVVALAADPHMHGVQRSYIPTSGLCAFTPRGRRVGCTGPNPTLDDPESAAQLDLGARWEGPVAPHTDLLLGVRYLNFVAHYDANPGLLADRNVGAMPVIGLRHRF